MGHVFPHQINYTYLTKEAIGISFPGLTDPSVPSFKQDRLAEKRLSIFSQAINFSSSVFYELMVSASKITHLLGLNRIFPAKT
jgi:hypothetical protein